MIKFNRLYYVSNAFKHTQIGYTTYPVFLTFMYIITFQIAKPNAIESSIKVIEKTTSQNNETYLFSVNVTGNQYRTAKIILANYGKYITLKFSEL